jgi:hypothetical protein
MILQDNGIDTDSDSTRLPRALKFLYDGAILSTQRGRLQQLGTPLPRRQ